MTDFEIPATGSAEVHVLREGYVLKVSTVVIPGHGAPFRPGACVTF